MASETDRLRLLEAKAPHLFLVGGALYAVLVVNRVLSTYTGTSFPQATIFAWVATILIPLGLLGLYPALVQRRPYLSRVAAGLTVIPIICSAIVAVGELIKAAGLLSEAPGALRMLPFVGIVSFYLVMALFGITTLLADTYPKAVGILMLVTASVFPLFFIVLSSLPAFIGNTVNLLVYLGIGIVLLNDGVSPDRAEPPTDATT